uniref:Zasp-like motif domain-containing protein n=1 Tax=Branchiostoma floridae TaxID=7739 RepID=C3ZFW9_BRAFL|eukprot:XP_002592596.1 hypothetical protein BRAFLDRAFT_68919 [Branchiostoma floridae]
MYFSVDVGAIKRAGERGLGQPATPLEIEAGGKKIIHAQYDTPLGLYSAEVAHDTLEGQLAELIGADGTGRDAGALYQMIQEEAARKARMQPRVAPPPPPEEPSGPGVYQAQSRSFRILQKMTEN